LNRFDELQFAIRAAINFGLLRFTFKLRFCYPLNTFAIMHYLFIVYFVVLFFKFIAFRYASWLSFWLRVFAMLIER